MLQSNRRTVCEAGTNSFPVAVNQCVIRFGLFITQKTNHIYDKENKHKRGVGRVNWFCLQKKTSTNLSVTPLIYESRYPHFPDNSWRTILGTFVASKQKNTPDAPGPDRCTFKTYLTHILEINNYTQYRPCCRKDTSEINYSYWGAYIVGARARPPGSAICESSSSSSLHVGACVIAPPYTSTLPPASFLFDLGNMILPWGEGGDDSVLGFATSGKAGVFVHVCLLLTQQTLSLFPCLI